MSTLDDLGRQISEVDIKAGLRDLNPEIHFDMGTNLDQWHPLQDVRQGVFYKGKHICSMDRGMVSEYKVWSVNEGPVEASFTEADNENVHIAFKVIERDEPHYMELYSIAQRKLVDHLVIREEDGALLFLKAWRMGKVRGRCMRVGWRHTFEALIHANIPGVTREAIAARFGVDMYKFPIGSPDVLREIAMEE